MKPGNTDLDKLIERLLPSIKKETPKPNIPKKKTAQPVLNVATDTLIKIKKVDNNLPYSCIVELEPPADQR